MRSDKLGQPVRPERWYSTIRTKVHHISEHPKLSVLRICMLILCIFFISSNLAYVFLFCF